MPTTETNPCEVQDLFNLTGLRFGFFAGDSNLNHARQDIVNKSGKDVATFYATTIDEVRARAQAWIDAMNTSEGVNQ